MNKIIVLLIVFAFSLKASATNYYVNDGSIIGDIYTTAIGNNVNPGTTAAPFASLTHAVNTIGLVSGDTVFVDAGLFYQLDENLLFDVNNVAIIGAGSLLTEFDHDMGGGDFERFGTITADNVTFQGFTITGYDFGGDAYGILIDGASNVTINDVLAQDSMPGGGSATIVIRGGSSVEFDGGGSNCNSPTSVAGGGVNIEGNGNTVVFNNYSFSSNFKALQGGSALYVVGDATTVVTLNNSIVADNENTSGTGGAVFVSGSVLNVRGTCFSNNSTNSGAGPKYGGAITIGRGAFVNISQCSFSGNSVSNSGKGGAISINTSFAGSGSAAVVNIDTCSFAGNSASSEGNDIYVRVGSGNAATLSVNECSWSGTSLDIRQDNTGAINIQNSGNPSATGSGINFSNTTLNSTSPATNCPILVGSCYSPICINPTPSGNSSQLFCSSDSPTIADLVVTGGPAIAWYNSSTLGTSYLPNDALIDGNSYWAADETPGCDTSFRFEVIVSINDAGDAGLPGVLTICQGTAPQNAELFASLNGIPDAGGTWTNSGLTYTYTVTSLGCPDASADIVVTEQAQPDAGTSGNLTICQGTVPTNAELFTSLNGTPSPGGTWTNSGLTYTYTVFPNLPCLTSATSNVLVIESDTLAPSGSNTQSFCADEIPMVSDLAIIGNSVLWYSDISNTNLLSSSELLINGNTYYATQTSIINGCESSTSFPVVVTLSDPFLDTNNYLVTPSSCGSSDGSITGITVSGGQPSYNWEWTNLSGLISNDQDITNTTAGSYTVVVTDALGCQDSVQALFIGNNGAANIDISSSAVVNETCGNNNGSITGLIVTGGNGVLSYEWSDGSSIISSDLDLFPISAGNYTLTVIDANNCVSTAGPFSLSDLDGPSLDLNSLAIENTTCNESNGSITGISVNGGNGVIQIEWSDGSSVIGNTLDINGLTAGSYSLVITDTNNCIATIDTTISSDPIPTVLAEDDYAMTDPSTEVIVIIDTNDIGDVTTIQIVNGPENGVATVDLMGNLTYTPNDGYSGIDSLVYTICDEFCSLECENASVYITVEDLVPLHIPNGFSPNSDGFNDTFVIEGLDQYPDNEIIIFNRWGDEVFSAGPYLNDWIGSTTNGKLKITGDQVTEGTYYYILDIHAEGIQPYNGFIELRRN
ncbi:gliding motility-associated C-terminal domain-containing protein [Flavobacteriales bacterium]|nr:gliding motility-associated C-terminal domain-containing protein [Flavobacteriales bacterium]